MPSDDEDEDEAIRSSDSDEEEAEVKPQKRNHSRQKEINTISTINKSNIPLPSDEEGKNDKVKSPVFICDKLLLICL
jgi:hypothetical protein